MGPSFTPQVRERFWGYVDKGSGCWLWTAGKDRDGYGVFTIDNKQYRAIRVSILMTGKQLGARDHVRHMCGHKACVNPAHLLTGTHLQNQRDKHLSKFYASAELDTPAEGD